MSRPLALLMPLLLAAGAAPAQSMFHGDVARTGVYRDTAPPPAGELLWAFNAGGAIVGSAVVDGGSSTSAAWTAPLRRGPGHRPGKVEIPVADADRLHPAVVGDSIYLVTSTGALAALDVATGAAEVGVRGGSRTQFEARNLHGYPPATQTMPDVWDCSSPLTGGGRTDGLLRCGRRRHLRRRCGYRRPAVDIPHRGRGARLARVADGTVFVGSWDSYLYALDAGTGQMKWSFKAGEDPAIHNQVGFQSSPAFVDGAFTSAAATPTSTRWTPRPGEAVGLPHQQVVGDRHAGGPRRRRLRGHLGQLAVHGARCAHGPAPLQLQDGRLHVLVSGAGRPAGLRRLPQRGALRHRPRRRARSDWTIPHRRAKADPLKFWTPTGALNQAAFAPFFGDFSDMYLDFYRFASIGAIMASPVVDGGVVYFGSMDGKLYAVR